MMLKAKVTSLQATNYLVNGNFAEIVHAVWLVALAVFLQKESAILAQIPASKTSLEDRLSCIIVRNIHFDNFAPLMSARKR